MFPFKVSYRLFRNCGLYVYYKLYNAYVLKLIYRLLVSLK